MYTYHYESLFIGAVTPSLDQLNNTVDEAGNVVSQRLSKPPPFRKEDIASIESTPMELRSSDDETFPRSTSNTSSVSSSNSGNGM